jgi:tRNA(adenine34) deaminase
VDHGNYLEAALREAEAAGAEGAAPVGSVIVARDGHIVARGRNRVLSEGDHTAHAEVDAIRNSGRAIDGAAGLVLYTTAEPCLMCLGAILLTPIEAIVWATGVPGTVGAYDAVVASGYRSERVGALRIIREPSPDLRARSRALLLRFYRAQGNEAAARALAEGTGT